MVSFSCEVCNDTVVKKKLTQHTRQCHGACFTCIDCSVTFYNFDWDKHTSCITESEKYEKSLYKPKKKGPQPQKTVEKVDKPVEKVETKETKVEKKEKKDKKDKKEKSKKEKPSKLSELLSDSITLKDLLNKLPKSEKSSFKKYKVVKKDGKIILSP
ncbi:UPF0743 protein [[Candida] jaroonii]|uniref:UPF0743 protein n=1 Tax=[Candida] jaroonii TaxID=467808 RepID=A0ACA9Y1W3_9ASCO|nr:UPF0743 protein [[Candida] jaroonii]